MTRRRGPLVFILLLLEGVISLPDEDGVLWAIAEEGHACQQVCFEGCLEPHSVLGAAAATDILTALTVLDLPCSSIAVYGGRGGPAQTLTLPGGRAPSGSSKDVEAALLDIVEGRFNSGGSPYIIQLDTVNATCELRERIPGGKPRSCESIARPGHSNVCACARFDCSAGASNIEEGWSSLKKQWCCDNRGVGCKEAQSWKVVEDDPFDCQVGKKEWGEVWEVGTNKWCCDKTGRGCLEISKVTGARARFASGDLDLVVGRPHVLASDAEVPLKVAKGIAEALDLDPRSVTVRLGVVDGVRRVGQPASLRGSASVLLEFTVSVPVDAKGQMAVASSGLSAPMALAVMSAGDWTRLIHNALGDDGGYLFSVGFVGEVALSDVNPLPVKRPAGLSQGVIQLIIATGVILLLLGALAVYSAPTIGQEDAARMPDLSPKKQLLQMDTIEDFLSESTVSPRKVQHGERDLKDKSQTTLQLEEKESEPEDDESPRKEPDRQQAKKKCCCGCGCGCGPACGTGCGCGPGAGCGNGICGSRKGVMEPAVAGAPVPRSAARGGKH